MEIEPTNNGFATHPTEQDNHLQNKHLQKIERQDTYFEALLSL